MPKIGIAGLQDPSDRAEVRDDGLDLHAEVRLELGQDRAPATCDLGRVLGGHDGKGHVVPRPIASPASATAVVHRVRMGVLLPEVCRAGRCRSMDIPLGLAYPPRTI